MIFSFLKYWLIKQLRGGSFIYIPQIRNLYGLVGFCLQSDKIHFIVHISCTTEMSQTQNPLTP